MGQLPSGAKKQTKKHLEQKYNNPHLEISQLTANGPAQSRSVVIDRSKLFHRAIIQ